MKNLIKNKQADSKILSIWWFAVLAAIGVGVVIATLVFFSGKVDVRLLEADVLSARIINCVVTNGVVLEEFIQGNFDIFEKCGINKEIIDSSNYYLKISLFDENKKALGKNLVFGNNAFEEECKVGASMITATNFARCTENEAIFVNSNNKNITLNIVAGSNYEYRLKEAGK
jgi:hypothetical protein